LKRLQGWSEILFFEKIGFPGAQDFSIEGCLVNGPAAKFKVQGKSTLQPFNLQPFNFQLSTFNLSTFNPPTLQVRFFNAIVLGEAKMPVFRELS